jgi:hypothetical protein
VDLTQPRRTIDEAVAMAKFATYLHGWGYRSIRDLGDGRFACLWPLLYTTAIVTGRWGNYHTTEDRWCFHDAEKALAALDSWERVRFEGEPTGWHRHPDTGRRVRDDGTEYVEP